MLPPDGSGFYIIEDYEVLPAKFFGRSFDFGFQDTFTADPASDFVVTPAPHTQIDAEVVAFSSTGTLPAPLSENLLYRVVNSTATAFQVSLNITWPTISIINITDTGVGAHRLWIRLFEDAGGTVSVNPATDVFTTTSPHHLKAANRIHFVTTGTLPIPLVVGADYHVDPLGLTDTQFKIGMDITSTGTGSHKVQSPAAQGSVSYPSGLLGGLGIDTVYMTGEAGRVSIIGGGGGGADAEGAGGEPLVVEMPRPTIKVRDPELASLIRRARRAARTIEDLTIVGASGNSESGFSL
ncbi:MAG TPA: hypothetical protein VFH87_07185 [Candidatus Udaeobacter sp.]|nr:hypothetical protein [Candidatus Udaeobacter sp.]